MGNKKLQKVEDLVPLKTLFGDKTAQIEKHLRTNTSPLRLWKNEELALWGEKSFTCIQCGVCCFQYEVEGVPGYKEKKPICEECLHHAPPVLENGEWSTSRCNIYANRPVPCASFVGNISPYIYHEKDSAGNDIIESPCAEGIMYWQKLQKIYGGEIPEQAKRFFPEIEE